MIVTYAGMQVTKMTPVKAALLSLFMFSGILVWGIGIYAADVSADHVAVDGYGVSAVRR